MVNFRVYLVVALVLLSLYLIVSPFVFKKGGVVVSFVDENSTCSNVKEGYAVNQVSGAVVEDSRDFEIKTQFAVAGTYVPLVVNGGPAGCTSLRDGYLGFAVSDAISSQQIKLSAELGPSYSTTLKPEDAGKIHEVSDIIGKRISILKLVGYSVETSGESLKITSIEKNVDALTKACKFEIGINRALSLSSNSTSVDIDGKAYDISVSDSTVVLNGTEHQLASRFYLGNIETSLQKESNNTFLLKQIFVNNTDARIISGASLTFIPGSSAFRLQFPLGLSGASSEKFKEITTGLKSVFISGVSILDAQFEYTLDGKSISQIPVPTEISRQRITSIGVVGFDKDRKNLENLAVELNLCLNSGVISTPLEKISAETIAPTGRSVAELSLSGLVIASLAASFLLVQVRYKVYRFWYQLTGIALAELLIVFGFIVAAQHFTLFLIDLITVVGFAVFGALSVVQMVLGMEYILHKKDLSLSYRIKKFNRLNSMINLALIVAGLVLLFFARGFGFVLLFGSVTGMTISKPIFFSALSRMSI